MQEPAPAAAGEPAPPPRRRGGRPRHAPGSVRTDTIGVRVTPAEHAALRTKAESLGTTPGRLHEAKPRNVV